MTLRAADGCCCGARLATRLRGRRLSVATVLASALKREQQSQPGGPTSILILVLYQLTLGASATCGTSTATGDDYTAMCSCSALSQLPVFDSVNLTQMRRRKLSVYRMDIDRHEAEAADQAAGEQAAAEGAQAASVAAAGKGGQDGAASHLELYDEFGQRQSSRFQQVCWKPCTLVSKLAHSVSAMARLLCLTAFECVYLLHICIALVVLSLQTIRPGSKRHRPKSRGRLNPTLAKTGATRQAILAAIDKHFADR